MTDISPDTNNLAWRTGTAGVYLFGVGAFLSSAASNVAFGLLVLAIGFDWRRAWKVLRGEPAFWLFVGFALYLAFALTWVWPPEGRMEDIDGAGRFLKLWLFLPLAYWLGGDITRIHRFLICVMAGFLLGRIAAIDWTTLNAGLAVGERLRLGISSINHFGLYAGTLFLGTLAYSGTVWQVTARHPLRFSRPLRIGWFVIAVTALYWMLASQSRGAIVSIVVALLFAAALVAYSHRRQTTPVLFALHVTAILLTALLGGWFIAHRWAEDSATLNGVLAGDWSGIPYSPIGIRLHMLRVGWAWWLEQPWFGYGPGAVEQMLDSATQELRIFKHLHNTLIDNLVRLGTIGALLLQSLFLYVAFALWRRLQAGGIPLALGVFTLSTLMLAFLFGQTDYRMGAWDWRHYWVMIGGTAYAIPLAHRSAQADAHPDEPAS